MRKNFGQKTWMYPMPVLMIGTYDENGKANLMNAAWGGFSNTINTIAELEPGATTDREGFTVSRNTVQDAEPDIIAWLETSGYTK